MLRGIELAARRSWSAPDESAAEVQECQERFGELLAARREPTETLQLLEEVLHQVALSMQVSIDVALHLSGRMGGDDDLAPLPL